MEYFKDHLIAGPPFLFGDIVPEIGAGSGSGESGATAS